MSRRGGFIQGPNKLRLGVFALNCSSGLAITQVPERWQASWKANERVAQWADEAGIEFLLPIARWRGYGGSTNFQKDSFETITWACGLLAKTRRLNVLGTIHVPLFHPVIAAKQVATIDHLSEGRFGLNIVCGWNEDEFQMFGERQREHDVRYEYGQEWLEIVDRIWASDAPFDYSGQFFQLKDVVGYPKPWGGARPVIMNAGASSAGREFGIRNCDVLFTIIVDIDKARLDIEALKNQAASSGRSNLEVFTSCYAVCRPTRDEAEEYHRHYAVDNADSEAVERVMRLQGLHTKGRPPELQQKFRERFAGGHGSFPLIGSPDMIADKLAEIASAGISGVTLGFVDYESELPYFVDEVLPRLRRMGLRAT